MFLAVLEGGLRAAGYGYKPDFLVRNLNGSLAANEKFGWRLFPRAIARTPAPEILPDPDAKRRVFILGESAAMGFPDPALGLAPQLQARLGADWRVVNVAMTAINSHTVREIAAECARQKPAAFVVYMGNNEVVGPYGAGSIFGSFSGNLAMIRLQLWVRSWRLGQLIASLTARPPAGAEEWRGLEFFVRNQVPPGDPRLARVYHHFRNNLQDIVRLGQRAGARVIVSTVAVNLRDCPPFASPDGAANAAYAAGDFARARDLDALRFRADSEINRIIREVAAEEHADLVDAEQAIAPSAENFWEHVHLRPRANAQLAELVSAKLTPTPKPADLPVTAWDAQRLTRTIAGVMTRPPFTAAHRARLAPVREPADLAEAKAVWTKRAAENPDDLSAQERLAELETEQRDFASAETVYRGLLAKLPLRAWYTGLAECLVNQAKFAPAEQAYRDALAIDDRFAPALLGLGVARAAQSDLGGAESMIRRALAIQPGLAEAHNSLGRLLEAQGNRDAAEAEYRQAIDRKPDFAMARYNLAGLYARSNRSAQAIDQLRAALSADPGFAAAHYDLGLLLANRGALDEAVVQYAEALKIDPRNADALNNWGTALARQNRTAEARAKFEAALAINPQHAAARRNLGLLGAR